MDKPVEINHTPADNSLAETWGTALDVFVCERCDWSYLLAAGSPPQLCPHCFQHVLTRMKAEVDGLTYVRPPELILPYELTPGQLGKSIQDFASGIPYPPDDLNPKMLQTRLQHIYLPVWLLDADVQAVWQADAGFDYEVVSHQDRFDQNRGGWYSREVTEGRIRWEPRLGKLERSYHNIAAPALEEDAQFRKSLGQFDWDKASPFKSELLSGASVRLPNRAPQDAWSEAQPTVQTRAAEECRQAASAGHLRQFSWKPEFRSQNWTLLLLPVLTTFYKDDDGIAQPVLIHGQTGRIHGARRASMRRAQRTALTLLGIAVVVFLLSLVISLASMLFAPLLILGVVGMVASLLIGLGAIYPIGAAWWFNRNPPAE